MGELTVAELTNNTFEKYSLILIDEIESSLHVRTQRRMMRYLATLAREKQCQIIISTHSPTILEELPISARSYILRTNTARKIVVGVTPQFAMTKMDDREHPDTEVYVEDERARTFLQEILSQNAPDLVFSTKIVPFGKANLGVALGQLVKEKRLTRPTAVFLDGDQNKTDGCGLLPGGDAPERVVYRALAEQNWGGLPERIGRQYAETSDACKRSMTLPNHHEWVHDTANHLRYPPDTLWLAMCAEWVKAEPEETTKEVIELIRTAGN